MKGYNLTGNGTAVGIDTGGNSFIKIDGTAKGPTNRIGGDRRHSFIESFGNGLL